MLQWKHFKILTKNIHFSTFIFLHSQFARKKIYRNSLIYNIYNIPGYFQNFCMVAKKKKKEKRNFHFIYLSRTLKYARNYFCYPSLDKRDLIRYNLFLFFFFFNIILQILLDNMFARIEKRFSTLCIEWNV